MNIILLLFVSTLLNISVEAEVISGTVTDENNRPLPGVNITVEGTNTVTQTNFDGKYTIKAEEGDKLVFSYIGYKTAKIKVGDKKVIDVALKPDFTALEEQIVVTGIQNSQLRIRGVATHLPPQRESYNQIEENIFKSTNTTPLSTFSIDVDKASYSNVRRMINNGQKVHKDAVKIEEMLNYFNYDYAQPAGEHPFAIHTAVAETPWNSDTRLVKIALQGKTIPLDDVPASNLVFLLDVSGSMNSQNKLPLLKSAFKLLTAQLREEDKVAIVVYAGAAGVVLPSTKGSDKKAIFEAIDNLSAGGSTAGGEGIELAYKIAQENFIENGNNRVILATDGDFNVGASSDRAMGELIEEKRDTGIFLTALGFGMGNYQDSKLETLAQKGNGNHAYIDTMQEAKRVLGTEFGGTIYTIAKDVKIQVEFNPAKVQAYRLIGYENRLLNNEDFNDDKKDAGELGSGHTVTALYEIIPAGVNSKYLKDIDDLKYSDRKIKSSSEELLTVKFRYQKPEGSKSILITKSLKDEVEPMDADFKFASAVALFGMQLRESEFTNNAPESLVISLADAGRGEDPEGYRAEFIRLVKTVNTGQTMNEE
ncbi:von Willebrand factor type A domain-containing protein [Salinimicrobium sp. MT39]|uniref:von Willebrand factor type A domain-containing protein n=1 Tax=Salinimicrobium profundisediminis TaxID=2994553 RepID=A0A9X3CU96_9FLAO|nr:von Willebrand factor type A domain-containing protein [Salinimicrobium profundisediminis]MCX2836680.1 von Willebrand factor type A domain-containing protein [Salinimicrobium profundisediminis]